MKVQPENNVENREPGPAGSSDQGTGQNSADSGDVRTSKRTKTAPPLVERVTALRGQGIAALRNQRAHSVARPRRTSIIRDAEIPYLKFEAAARNLVCCSDGTTGPDERGDLQQA